MKPIYWWGYLGLLFLINVIFWSLPRALNVEDEQSLAKDRWSLSGVQSLSAIDTDALLRGGFWGDASGVLNGVAVATGEATPEVELAEAHKLRTQVKAIIYSGLYKQVLFSKGKAISRVSVGERLPQTEWLLIEVGQDWLKLSKENGVGGVQLLRLFNDTAKH
jgi:hypothetical protein